MTRISVYDIEAETIEDICEKYDCTEAHLIKALIEALEDHAFDLEDYL